MLLLASPTPRKEAHPAGEPSLLWVSPTPQKVTYPIGTPFGTSEFIAAHVENVMALEEQLLQNLRDLKSIQASWLLLYYCAVPRANHLLRTTIYQRSTIAESGLRFVFR